MSWEVVGRIVAKSAPLLGSLFGPMGEQAGALIASAFGCDNEPNSIIEAIKRDPEAAVILREIEANQKIKLEEIQLERERLYIAEQTKQATQVNLTMRKEIVADSWFKSCWRPLFGYIVATSFGSIMYSCSYAFIHTMSHNIADIVKLANACAVMISSMSVMWGLALPVLGIVSNKRSEDKATMLGIEKPTGIISKAIATFGNKNG